MATTLRWLSGITAALVLIQAMLIGQALYVNGMTTVELHGWLGSGSFLMPLLLTALAAIGVRRGELSGLVAALALLVTLLMVAQLGLGYAGRRGGWSAAIHIPNGVLIAGLLFALLTTSPAPATRTGPLRS